MFYLDSVVCENITSCSNVNLRNKSGWCYLYIVLFFAGKERRSLQRILTPPRTREQRDGPSGNPWANAASLVWFPPKAYKSWIGGAGRIRRKKIFQPRNWFNLMLVRCTSRVCEGIDSTLGLCEDTSSGCQQLITPFQFASQTCENFRISKLSGIGMQLTNTATDPDRSCQVACQDRKISYRRVFTHACIGQERYL